MCTQSVSQIIHGKRNGFMPFDNFKAILENIKENNQFIGKFLPFGLGESLLHPAFPKILSTLLEFNKGKKYFGSIDLHTNAILLDDTIIDILLDSPSTVDTLSFSLDAVSSDTYYSIRRNRQLEVAYKNIKNFYRRRKAAGKRLPKTHLQFIVMEENHNEAGEFLKYWSEFLNDLEIEFQVNYDWFPPMRKDTIFFKRLNPFKNADLDKAEALHFETAKRLGLIKEQERSEERIINSQEFIEHERPEARRPCSGPFKYQSISWDGTVTVCCIDTGRELAIGNINDMSLSKLWDGEKIKQYREWHILGEFQNMPKCTICHNLDSPQLSDEEVVSYLKKIGREDMIEKYFKRIYG